MSQRSNFASSYDAAALRFAPPPRDRDHFINAPFFDAVPVMPLPRCARCERMRGPVLALTGALIVSICISAFCLALLARLPSSRRGAAAAPPVVATVGLPATGGADFTNGGAP